MSGSGVVPSFMSTYYTGASLHLHLHEPPEPPKNPRCTLEDRGKALRDIQDRYKTSVGRRVPLSAAPEAYITLDQSLQINHHRFAHVWSARIHSASGASSFPEIVVAKIFDPVYYDDDDLVWLDPFSRSDLSIWNEVNSYRRLASLQGKNVPRFYGHFVASLGEMHESRTVSVLVMEHIDGKDVAKIVPQGNEDTVCTEHLDALYTEVLRVHFTIWKLGVQNYDMVPRNVILRVSDSRFRCTCRSHDPFCSQAECPFRSEICCSPEHISVVIVDFEKVELKESALSVSPTRMKEIVQERKDFWLHGFTA
ncbi:hypothetical protein VKT23_005276 [Stygiomarasmius scandens]|uniref:Protein kinase domain-containing protein n=1 Tax=Marasmiellus scandens TaxID=2682957 RepID=A0ABR1JPT6_9AGAR